MLSNSFAVGNPFLDSSGLEFKDSSVQVSKRREEKRREEKRREEKKRKEKRREEKRRDNFS
jgi:hypothetical protein